MKEFSVHEIGLASYRLMHFPRFMVRVMIGQPLRKQWHDEQEEERNCDMAVYVGNRFEAVATHRGYRWREVEACPVNDASAAAA